MNKYIVYICSLVMLFMAACDPMDEVYEELDEANGGNGFPASELEFTLTEDDYGLIAKQLDSVEYFRSYEDAKEYIPALLDSLYPNVGGGSSATVTFNLYVPVFAEQEITLTGADYTALELEYPNLSSQSEIIAAADLKVPEAEDGDVISLTYDYYSSGQVTERTSLLGSLDGAWYTLFVPTSDDYQALGQSYPNFDDFGEATHNLPIYFNSLFPYAVEGETKVVYIDYYGGEASSYLIPVYFNDGSWEAPGGTIQFGKSEGIWVPDNTIRYTLSGSDYDAIAANEEIGSESARGNLASYGNFNTNSWSDEDILAGLSYILLENFPGYEEGQRVLVSFDTYPDGLKSMHVVLSGGEYILFEN
ncbi:hypothetical protein LVD15_05385 [Fulvivirga maritima]|uniref:hypothetical protein n=1 Tax=Fulvivirga maritima TaxID=2904247 RepID=UPI001F23CB26|nr:hypothetical protein [Fulvivirga maritima]UII27857.1 hypothetical protein LVD15_05385 [Fulvivirga maritima]